ncbi:DUF2637 domain-containing protein [Streptomyces sp. NBC_00986]|uniref:DUF2637 domain-containing protein n=1 Tax=Streptomyces sp. NBC_00986 TaxID=2903702 RepID=UPI00386C7267|nr:DUF2637 domain-containing protein [Streptomyces sp. NBC_00986]
MTDRPTRQEEPAMPATSGTRRNWPTRLALFLVMGAALAVGTWSVYTLLHDQFDAPKTIALFGCLMFDAAALFFARLAQQYATSDDSGLAPRAAMLAMIGTSSWVNWQHAQLEGWGIVGSVVMAAAPVIAELAFEMWHRFEHREELRRRGRVPEAAPALGFLSWLLHPRKSFGVFDKHVEARLVEVAAAAERRVDAARGAERVTVMREDDAPPQPAPHHLVIEVRQPVAIAAAPAPEASPVQPAARQDAAEIPADQEAAAPSPQQPADPAVVLRRIDEALHGRSLNKADAVRAVMRVAPDATAPQIAQHLTRHGYEKADASYVRTVQSRDNRKKAEVLPADTATDAPAAAASPDAEQHADGTGQYL